MCRALLCTSCVLSGRPRGSWHVLEVTKWRSKLQSYFISKVLWCLLSKTEGAFSVFFFSQKNSTSVRLVSLINMTLTLQGTQDTWHLTCLNYRRQQTVPVEALISSERPPVVVPNSSETGTRHNSEPTGWVMAEVKKREKTGSGRWDVTRKLEKVQAATNTQIQTGGECGIQSTNCQIKKENKKNRKRGKHHQLWVGAEEEVNKQNSDA